ncbi:peptidyl-prolyl cis-trans isomerase cpr6, partial [Ascosphaera acerosa]
LLGDAYDAAAGPAAQARAADSTGDAYEEFPEDGPQDLLLPDYLRIATELKACGNTAFKAGQLSLGIDKYQKALRYLNEAPDAEDDVTDAEGKVDEAKKAANEKAAADMAALRFALHNNSALLAIKLAKFADAQTYATYAMECEDMVAKAAATAGAAGGVSDTDKAKARFRRAVALVGLKNDEEALRFLKQAQELAPADASIVNERKKVEARIKEQERKEKAAFKKFFS